MNHFEVLVSLFIVFLGLGLLAVMRSNQSNPESAASEQLPIPVGEKNEIQELSTSADQGESSGEIQSDSSLSISSKEQSVAEQKTEPRNDTNHVINIKQNKTFSDIKSDTETESDTVAISGAIDKLPAESLTNTDSPAVSPPSPSIAASNRPLFDRETFPQEFVETLLQVRSKSLQAATAQDCYITLTSMVRQRLLQLDHPEAYLTRSDVRIVAEIAAEFAIGSHLEANLIGLKIYNLVSQGLEGLGINLDTLIALEETGLVESSSGSLISGYLESLATARLPAIGYGMRCPASSKNQSNFWEIQRSEAGVTVKFGGGTQVYTGTDGRLRVRWTPREVIKGIPYDTLIPGYGTNTVSVLRLWQSSEELCQPSIGDAQNEEQQLKQQFFLASCAIQDVIWLHERTGEPIELLHERFALQLNGAALGLAIAELMHWLVDEYGLEWDQAWSITQKTFSCTLHSLTLSAPGDRWSIDVFSRLLPRHLEIIYEINRRFWEQAWTSELNSEEQIRQLSLIDEAADPSLKIAHLTWLGSGAVSIASGQRHLQQTCLADFAKFYPGKFSSINNGINVRQFLLQSNPWLSNLITQWIGTDWVTHPQALKQLEGLVQNVQFCSEWWQVRRTIKQDIARLLSQQTGVEINVNSLFDVQIAPIEVNQRQLLNLLHIITLYVRIKINATTDTIQHFTHRSVPRTCIFAGQVGTDAVSRSIAQLLQAVATTINNDPEVQGKLQVIVLAEADSRTMRQLHTAADLAEYLPLAGQVAPSLIPFASALNGVLVLGSLDSSNLELQQEVGAKNSFPFGMNAAEVSQFQAKGYDPLRYYSDNPDLQQVIKPIASGFFSFGDPNTFKDLGNWLLTQDPALVLAEYPSYLDWQERVSQSYQDQKNWTRTSILTIARTGNLSSDRTIQEYQNLWQIEPVTVVST